MFVVRSRSNDAMFTHYRTDAAGMNHISNSSAIPRRGPMVWSALAFLVVVSSADIFIMVFVVPKFRQIYSDMLGTRPLPSSTSLVLEGRYLFEALAFAYLGGGILVVCLASRRVALRSVSGLILAAVIQAGFTTCVLFLPLVGDIVQGVNKP